MRATEIHRRRKCCPHLTANRGELFFLICMQKGSHEPNHAPFGGDLSSLWHDFTLSPCVQNSYRNWLTKMTPLFWIVVAPASRTERRSKCSTLLFHRPFVPFYSVRVTFMDPDWCDLVNHPPPIISIHEYEHFYIYASLFTKLVAYTNYRKINNKKLNNTVNYKEYTEHLTKYYMFQLLENLQKLFTE